MRKRVLSVFSLVMINIIAVDNLRTLPISAEYGLSLITYYLIGAFTFMIPLALVAAELATGWPNTGGAYVWVREAFGKFWAFLAIWLLWIYNVVWYPTMLAFLATALAYLVNPSLANNKIYMLSAILIMFWFTTIINSFNMRTSSLMSTLGALIGTIIPMVLISLLGLIWLYLHKKIEISLQWSALVPNLNNFDNLAFMVAVLFGLIGMEMSAVHAEDVKNPQRDYPLALLYSTIIILITLILGSLSVALVVPHAQLSIVSGLLDAFKLFFNNFNLNWMNSLIILIIVLGGLGGVSTWVIGPTKGLLVASEDGSIPPLFQKTNKNGMPIAILVLQAIIVTILSLLFLYMPTINSSFWILTALTSQLALIYYILVFMAAIKLRYSHPEVPRAYKIPGGKLGIWLIGAIGTLSCLSVIIFGFLPPPNINIGSIYTYEWLLILGIFIFIGTPFIIYWLRKPSWTLLSNRRT